MKSIQANDIITLNFFWDGVMYPVKAIYTGKAITKDGETYYQFTRHDDSEKHGTPYVIGYSLLPTYLATAWDSVDTIELPE